MPVLRTRCVRDRSHDDGHRRRDGGRTRRSARRRERHRSARVLPSGLPRDVAVRERMDSGSARVRGLRTVPRPTRSNRAADTQGLGNQGSVGARPRRRDVSQTRRHRGAQLALHGLPRPDRGHFVRVRSRRTREARGVSGLSFRCGPPGELCRPHAGRRLQPGRQARRLRRPGRQGERRRGECRRAQERALLALSRHGAHRVPRVPHAEARRKRRQEVGPVPHLPCAGRHLRLQPPDRGGRLFRRYCASCHTAPAKHRSGKCETCHRQTGESWAFTHPKASADCVDCHKGTG